MSHTPLDELMHRRKLYGSRVATSQNPLKFRSPGTSRQERISSKSRRGDAGTEVEKRHKQVVNSSKAITNSTKSYLSPMEGTPSSTMAITPSPSRRHAPSHPLSEDSTDMDVGRGPVKDVALTPGNIPSSTTNGSSPNSTSPSSSVMFAISPSGLMTPGASPLSGGHNAFDGPGFNGGFGEGNVSSSPFPYIDWGSPLEKIPHCGRRKGHSNGTSPKDSNGAGVGDNEHEHYSIPSHLAVPGANSIAWNTNARYRHDNPRTFSNGYQNTHHHPNNQAFHHQSGGYYSGHQHSPGSSQYTSMMPPPSPYPIMDGVAGELDLDEEEMQLLWRRLATHANQKRIRERDAAAMWMYNRYGHSSSFSASTGCDSTSAERNTCIGFENSMGSNFAMAHSFSSPMERPEARKRNDANTTKEESKKAKELPSLQDPI